MDAAGRKPGATAATLDSLESSRGWAAMVRSLKSRLFPVDPGATAATLDSLESSRGFILIFSLLMLMGISTLAVGMFYNAKHGQVTAQNHKNRIRAFYASDGMRALLAQEVLDGNQDRYIDTAMAGGIDGEVWSGAGGGLPALEAAVSGPPTRTVESDYLGSHWKLLQGYGVRWRGYVTPPATGSYTFYVRADDQGAFYLGSDENIANLSRKPIAYVGAPSFSWPATGTGVSKPVMLRAGKRYCFEFLHTQDGGEGFGQVGWSGPNYLSERPISGKRLSRYGSSGKSWDTTSLAGGTIRYSLVEAGQLVFAINTEAVLGGPGDTAFRSPLSQVLNLRGETPAPPESLWQRVIFYDFHTDGSNPEFERKPNWGPIGVKPGMVRAKGLRYTPENAAYFGRDSIGKPILANPKYNCGVDKWFAPWKPGWFKTYAYAGGGADCAETPAGNDRAFENIVVMDSLPFRRRADLGVNAYQFNRFAPDLSPNPGFTPLDGRGFGSEGRVDLGGTPRNYGFCMELHTSFEHTSGLYFDFNGDDDVWLFINDSLVMDLGFVHTSASAILRLDDLPLTFGKTYPMDFFYCERQSTGSSINLITNLPARQAMGRPAPNWLRDYGELD